MQANRTETPLGPACSKSFDGLEHSSAALPVKFSPKPSSSSSSFPLTPSTTVLCPASADVSLSATVPFLSPSSPFTAPSPPPCFPIPNFSLTTLPDDVLRRIICHLFLSTKRGTPYYPPSPPLDILPLSETCTSLRQAVSRHLTTDLLWLRLPSGEIPSARLRPCLLAWYRFAGPFLQALTLSSRLAPPSPIVDDVIRTVAAARPALRSLDLSVFTVPELPSAEGRASLREILLASRVSLTELRLNVAATHLLDLIAEVKLTSLTTLDLRHDVPADQIRLLALLHSLRIHSSSCAATSMLETIVIRASEPLPPELRPEALAAAASTVKKFNYVELSALRADCVSLSTSFLALVKAYKGLEELHFKDATLDFAQLKPFLERDSHRNLTRVSLNNCNLPVLLSALPTLRMNAGLLIRGLDLSNQQIGVHELTVISKYCPAVENLGLRMPRNGTHGLTNAMHAMSKLRSLSLRFSGSDDDVTRERCREDVTTALAAGGENFAKFDIHGESLSVRGLASVFIALRTRLEYVVTGVHAPGVSLSRAIMALLEIVKRRCTNMRILCFGLALVYDPSAEQLNRKFVELIDVLEDQLIHLDTSWLRRNAASLLAIPRPEDFVDWPEEANLVIGVDEIDEEMK